MARHPRPTIPAAASLTAPLPKPTSYAGVIAELCRAATRRVLNEPRVGKVPPLRPTPKDRELAREFRRLTARQRAISNAFRRRNITVADHGKLTWTYGYQDHLRSAPNRQRAARLATIDAMRMDARILTLGMTPAEARTYFVKLRNALEKI